MKKPNDMFVKEFLSQLDTGKLVEVIKGLITPDTNEPEITKVEYFADPSLKMTIDEQISEDLSPKIEEIIVKAEKFPVLTNFNSKKEDELFEQWLAKKSESSLRFMEDPVGYYKSKEKEEEIVEDLYQRLVESKYTPDPEIKAAFVKNQNRADGVAYSKIKGEWKPLPKESPKKAAPKKLVPKYERAVDPATTEKLEILEKLEKALSIQKANEQLMPFTSNEEKEKAAALAVELNKKYMTKDYLASSFPSVKDIEEANDKKIAEAIGTGADTLLSDRYQD
jgi:hypothetical protein